MSYLNDIDALRLLIADAADARGPTLDDLAAQCEPALAFALRQGYLAEMGDHLRITSAAMFLLALVIRVDHGFAHQLTMWFNGVLTAAEPR